MSETARIVFSSFRAGGDPMLDSWNRFRDSVVPVPAPTAAGEPAAASIATRPSVARANPGRSGVWRILATNNRELCRAAHIYPTFDGAHGHVSRLREHADELELTTVAGPGPGSRGWYLTHRGVVVITCARWYSAAASSSEAAHASLEALAGAVITSESRDVTAPGRVSGSRRSRADVLAW